MNFWKFGFALFLSISLSVEFVNIKPLSNEDIIIDAGMASH